MKANKGLITPAFDQRIVLSIDASVSIFDLIFHESDKKEVPATNFAAEISGETISPTDAVFEEAVFNSKEQKHGLTKRGSEMQKDTRI